MSRLQAAEQLRRALQMFAATLTEEQALEIATVYPVWEANHAYQVGDIRLAAYEGTHQPWRCRQEHDTAAYPDITPDGSAWRTFWVPFHGTGPQTAQDWVAPTMAEDMYKAGEYMIYTDGITYRCLSDTNFSPEDYPEAWECVEA